MPNRKDRTRSLAARARFRIDDLQVQPDRLVVLRGDQEIKLELRMMEVLVMLAEHACDTVTKEQLLVEVWGSTVYGDSPVSKTVSLLRERIDDDAQNPRYIQTVIGIGYRLILPASLPEDYRRIPSEPWSGGNPYVGLSAFDAAHAPVFCGRSRMVADLLRAMRNQIDNQRRFVLMVGASGCGKTSLLRAGAIPLLTKPDGFDGLRSLSIADCDLAAANAGDPLAPLIAALATWSIDERPVFPQQTQAQLKSLLTGSPESIAGFVAEAFRKRFPSGPHEQPHAHLLLTIDHAEALVAGTDIDADARDGFLRLLLALCASPHVLVVMIARSDFYPKLIEALPALAERKAGDGHLDILAPRYGEIGEIIRTPAWKADIGFGVDPETMTRLDDALLETALAQPDALPLLQHTLQTLYDRCKDQRQLTFAVYNEMGGLEGAVAYRAEQVFATLPENAKASLDKVLSRLIVIQPDSDVVSARRADIDAFDADARTLIDAFISARLFVGGLHDGRPTVGVVHEALLRRWPRASEWTQDNRRLLQAKARLERAARRWAEEGRSPDHLLNPGRPLMEAREAAERFTTSIGSEVRDYLLGSERAYKKRRTIRRAAMIALSILTLISLTSAIVAVQARKDAEKRELESRRLTEYLLGPLAEELRSRGILGLLGEVGTEAINYLGDRDIENMSLSELSNTARAYRTVGEALLQIKSAEQAEKSFRQAYALADLAIRRSPNHEDALFERGNASFWIGRLDFEEKRYEAAKIHWEKYHEDSKTLLSIAPKKPRSQLEISYSENLLGTVALRQGDTETAMPYFMASLARKKALMDSYPDELEYRYEYIDSFSWITTTLEASGKLFEAASEYDRQIAMLHTLISMKKSNNKWKHRIANYLMLSATLEMGRNNKTKARERAVEAARIMKRLVDTYPETEEWSRDLAKARLILAETETLSSNRIAAAEELKQILKIAAEIDAESRKSVAWRSIEARARLFLSAIDQNAHKDNEIDHAIEGLSALARKNGSDDLIEAYAYGLLLRGIMHARSSNKELAMQDFHSSIKAIETTEWKKNPYRSWIWSIAQTMAGNVADAKTTVRWLAEIGYSRPIPGTNAPIQIPD